MRRQATIAVMTDDSSTPRRRRRPWLATGLASIALGVGLWVASAPLVMYEDTGWPWHASFSTQTEPHRATATVDLGNGEVDSFTGSEEEARAWMERKEAELKTEHGIDTKVAVGHALGYVSYALLALGTAILAGRLLSSVRNRRTSADSVC